VQCTNPQAPDHEATLEPGPESPPAAAVAEAPAANPALLMPPGPTGLPLITSCCCCCCCDILELVVLPCSCCSALYCSCCAAAQAAMEACIARTASRPLGATCGPHHGTVTSQAAGKQKVHTLCSKAFAGQA
jgi:hypothetical protein